MFDHLSELAGLTFIVLSIIGEPVKHGKDGMFAGTAYGTALNDRRQVAALDPAFRAAPYKAPPQAPVLYVKPGHCVVAGRAVVALPAGCDALGIAATVALQWTVTGATAVRLAIDVSIPHDNFYRPAVAELARDGFLPVGAAIPRPADLDALEIVTEIDGETVHRWSLSNLVRNVPTLIADVAAFMTPMPGDMLLVGTAFDRPTAGAGRRIRVSARGFPALEARIAAAGDGA